MLERELVAEINEHYLFHGTKADTVDVILLQGVDNRVGGDHLLFGRGAYFAESSTKADQYPGMLCTRVCVCYALDNYIELACVAAFRYGDPQSRVGGIQKTFVTRVLTNKCSNTLTATGGGTPTSSKKHLGPPTYAHTI